MRQMSFSLSGKYSDRDIKKSEMICLKLLEYKLDRMTAYDFLTFFLKNGILFDYEFYQDFDLEEFYDFHFKILNN